MLNSTDREYILNELLLLRQRVLYLEHRIGAYGAPAVDSSQNNTLPGPDVIVNDSKPESTI